ncbi:MAG: ankyrin repeat domain-containing protein [Thermoanaerobaculia bacterium]|nr:ankyrin repeat domain-containing protein [Thermoanaerobaculia bacterium]
MKLTRTARALALILALTITIPTIAAPKKKQKFDATATAALLEAATNRDGDAIVAALEAKADPNVKNDEGFSALMLSVLGSLFGDDEKVVAAFVKAKVDLEAKNKFDQTALMLASREGQWQPLEFLIKAGANVNAKDGDGWTALMLAAYNGQSKCVEDLIAAKADIHAKTVDGWDAVLLAINQGQGAAAEKLIKAGVTVPKEGPAGTSAPVIHAAYGGDLLGMRLVLESAPDLSARDKDGWSALAIAANNNYPQIVMELLRAGADPSLKDNEGRTALERAVETGRVEIAALLGGKWERPTPGGTKISVPCKLAGGNVDGFIEIRESDLLFSTVFPKPMNYYLGGGNTNRAKSSKALTFDGSVAPSFYLDTDANSKTGQKPDMFTKAAAGAEYSLEYGEMGTQVEIGYTNSDGQSVARRVFGNVFDPTIKKQGEYLDTSADDYYPQAENNAGVLQTSVPMSLFELKPGKRVRVVMEVGSCGSKEATFKLK